MTFAHTPGPWIATPLTYNWSIESEQGQPVARIPLGDVSLENLRLMKAAPDLLEVLQSIVASADANCGDSLANAINAARAAIAKAGGAA